MEFVEDNPDVGELNTKSKSFKLMRMLQRKTVMDYAYTSYEDFVVGDSVFSKMIDRYFVIVKLNKKQQKMKVMELPTKGRFPKTVVSEHDPWFDKWHSFCEFESMKAMKQRHTGRLFVAKKHWRVGI
jgi:hypothetical protein